MVVISVVIGFLIAFALALCRRFRYLEPPLCGHGILRDPSVAFSCCCAITGAAANRRSSRSALHAADHLPQCDVGLHNVPTRQGAARGWA